jgi:hypothetical protein
MKRHDTRSKWVQVTTKFNATAAVFSLPFPGSPDPTVGQESPFAPGRDRADRRMGVVVLV